MIIRKMNETDVPQVAAIEKDIFSQPWSEQGFLDSLRNPDALFLVAEEETANSTGTATQLITGYIGMYMAVDEGEITNVAVSNPFRKQGIGRMLVQQMLMEAQSRAITRVVLEVRVSNAPAIALYEQMEFYKIGTRKGFYDFPKEDADIMVWESGV